jgi:DNA-binding NarL/FixJ family response regulator
VNGARIAGDRRLSAGDELRLGSTRLVLKGAAPRSGTTVGLAEPPRLTGRERDVLVELCRPLSAGGAFSEPATVHEIAVALVVTDPAVKFHLANLFDKFEIAEGARRRARLANAALASGAVSMADFHASSG